MRDLGVGVGLRTPHYAHVLAQSPPVDFFEVISENFIDTGGHALEVLDRVRERYPVVLHGVSLSVGSCDPLNPDYLKGLKALVRRVKPPWASDHLCWTSAGGRYSHDLLPLPFTPEAARHTAERVRIVQDALEVPFAVENISSYAAFRDSTMTEWQFLAEVAEQADCGILLDVNNVYVTAHNHGFDPEAYLAAVPLKRVYQIHLAGHSVQGNLLLDTHDHPVPDPVWALYRKVQKRQGGVSTLIEWDDRIPPFETLLEEARKARVLPVAEEAVA